MKAVHQLRCRTSSLSNQTTCSDIGFSLRKCITRTRKECPGMNLFHSSILLLRNIKCKVQTCEPYWTWLMTISENLSIGQWTSWSGCSETCIRDYRVLPYKRRTRACKPYCNITSGGVEEQPCIDLPKCKKGISINHFMHWAIFLLSWCNLMFFHHYTSMPYSFCKTYRQYNVTWWHSSERRWL